MTTFADAVLCGLCAFNAVGAWTVFYLRRREMRRQGLQLWTPLCVVQSISTVSPSVGDGSCVSLPEPTEGANPGGEEQ